uniref:Uncharacterized protein n=1 Tax=Setaria viridis TaxID=4556 RepID=A0A4U6V7R3_SETVI|nr:hypothetical protein SEVIR_3G054032v2 [Setaria viridis]
MDHTLVPADQKCQTFYWRNLEHDESLSLECVVLLCANKTEGFHGHKIQRCPFCCLFIRLMFLFYISLYCMRQ